MTEVEVTLLQVISDLTYDFLTDNEAAQLPYNIVDLKKIELMAQRYLETVAGSLRSKGIKVKTMVTGRSRRRRNYQGRPRNQR